jgi:chloramphenicol-sensitive protein RarD
VPPRPAATDPRDAPAGLAFALLSYSWWGTIVPIYFWWLQSVGAVELVAHRIVWGLPVLALLLTWRRQWPAIRRALRERRTLGLMAITTLLIATNWFCFVYAIVTERALHASLGYYINPLVSVFLGMVVLGERLRPLQWVGLLLAVSAVATFAVAAGGLPWISLTLACSFGLYGLLRKQAPVDAIPGLTIEMTYLLLPSLIWLGVSIATGRSGFLVQGPVVSGLLLLAGVNTVLPLVWFTAAARRLRLATVGFLQYLAPTGQFLLAVTLFDEPFSAGRLATFVLIWAAVALYSLDAWRGMRAARGPAC